MRFPTILLSTLFFTTYEAHAFTIQCSVTTQPDQGIYDNPPLMKKSVIESWSPKKQAHVLDLKAKTATYKNFNLKTKLSSVNENRITWSYAASVDSKVQAEKLNVTFEYLYIRSTKKLATTVDFKGNYFKLTSIKGDCIETK